MYSKGAICLTRILFKMGLFTVKTTTNGILKTQKKTLDILGRTLNLLSLSVIMLNFFLNFFLCVCSSHK
jgi:hypothetical protein